MRAFGGTVRSRSVGARGVDLGVGQGVGRGLRAHAHRLGRLAHAFQLLDAVRGHRQHLDAFFAGLGGHHDGVVAEGGLDHGQGFA
jgi:hypothetical protein